MTLRQYSLSNGQYIWSGPKEDKLKAESVRKCVSFALKKQTDDMNNSEKRDQIEKLGVNPDAFFMWMNKVSAPFSSGEGQEIYKKPKVFWDYIFYNACKKLITSKQYARSFSQNGNYSRADFVELFDAYDRFVDEVFMQETENRKDYFIKSMDFYYLETYKRLDYIYKLAKRLENKDSLIICKDHVLVKLFHPTVCDVYDEEGVLKFGSDRIMYYKPMVMLEELWQQNEKYNEQTYEDMVIKFHFMRAKVYELFKYHFRFVSNDYEEISDFIKNHYNILGYHESKKIWFKDDKKRKVDQEARIIKAFEINEAIFGISDKRNLQT